MKKKWQLYNFLIGSMAATFLVGCQTVETSIGDVGGAAVGGALGYLSRGDLFATTVGSAGGVMASKLAQARKEKQLKVAYETGYADANNQNIKAQYWNIQNRQQSLASNHGRKSEWVPVVIPEQVIDGTILQERVEYIKVEKS